MEENKVEQGIQEEPVAEPVSGMKEEKAENIKVQDQGEKMNNKRILLYLGITFLLTYALEIFAIMPGISSTDPNEAMAAQSMLSTVMFMPALGALLARVLTGEKIIGPSLGLSLNLKGNLKYYGIAWFGVGALIILGTALYFLIFREQFDPDMGYAMAALQAQSEALGQEITMTTEQVKSVITQQIIMGFFISPLVNVVTCFGEEWGWRGYLLPKMMKKFSVVPTLLIIGVIWGLWHAPLTVMGHNYGIGYPGFPVVGILAMCLFCVTMGIIFSYITIKVNSCVPAILAHGMLNGFAGAGLYYTSMEHPYNVFLGPMPTGLIGGAGFIVLAAVLLYLLYKEEKLKKQI